MVTVVTGRAEFRRTAADAVGARVPVKVGALVADSFDAYRRARDGSGSVSLATTGGQERWSYSGVEPVERMQVDSGAVARGDAPHGATLRTLVRHDDAYHLRVGADAVHDSDPDREHDEARALVTAVEEAASDRVDVEVRE